MSSDTTKRKKRRVTLTYSDGTGSADLPTRTIRLIKESHPNSDLFPAQENRTAENECVYVSRLSELDVWCSRANKLNRPWFIATAARPHELTGKLIRVFILYVQKGLQP